MKEVIGMSNPQSPAYREGIWEIRETTITARLPEGAWVLQVGDIEFIRLQNGIEKGVSYCDAFIKPRESSRPYPVGRYASDKDGICKVLGQFADWNHVPLLDASGAVKTSVQVPAPIEKPRRQVIPFPKSPDYPLQAEKPPIPKQEVSDDVPQKVIGTAPGADPQQGFEAGRNMEQQQGYDPNQSFGQQQGYDNGQDFDPRGKYSPGQGFGPGQGWWQWTFNPANPKFIKTVTIISLVIAAMILLGVLGVFRGVRMQSVSGPGIVGIYFLLRAMKNRKAKNRYGSNAPPPGPAWDPFAGQPGAWNSTNAGPAPETAPEDENTPEHENTSEDENTPEDENTLEDENTPEDENTSEDVSASEDGNTAGNETESVDDTTPGDENVKK
jgi:hypothetical protein